MNKPLITRKILVAAIVAAGFVLTGFERYDSLKPKTMPEADWADSIAVAVKTKRFFMVDSNIYIAYKIPCYSEAKIKTGIFGRMIQSSYIDCVTCKPAKGKPNPKSAGECTVIRVYEPTKK